MIVSKLHGDMDDSPRVPKISHTPIQLPAHELLVAFLFNIEVSSIDSAEQSFPVLSHL